MWDDYYGVCNDGVSVAVADRVEKERNAAMTKQDDLSKIPLWRYYVAGWLNLLIGVGIGLAYALPVAIIFLCMKWALQ